MLRLACPEAAGGEQQLRVISRRSSALGCAPPILPRSNDWDLIDVLHVEQVTIDFDQERAVATNRGAQDGYSCRVPTHVRRQIDRLNNHGHAAKKCGELVSLTFGEAEFFASFRPSSPSMNSEVTSSWCSSRSSSNSAHTPARLM